MCAAMRATARPFSRALAMLEIVAAVPVGIGHHRLPADLVEGDVLRGMAAAVAIGSAEKTRSE